LKERDREKLARLHDPSGKGRVEFCDGLISNIQHARADLDKLCKGKYLRIPLGLIDAIEWEDDETGETEQMVEWDALQFELRLHRRRLFALQNRLKLARDYAQCSVKISAPRPANPSS